MRNLVVVLLILVVAGTMRFAKLGTWSFDGDELFTTLETNIFFGRTPVPEQYLKGGTVKPEDTQLARLPRMLPLANATQRLGYRLFGEDEFGARIMPAVFGTLGLGLVYLLSAPLFGTPGALTLTFLMMFWPAHVFFSQQNRFYMETFFFESIVFLLAAYVVKRRSVVSALFLGVAATGMILCHTLTGLVWGIVLTGIVVSWITERRFPPVGLVAALLGFSFLFVGFVIFHIVPLTKGWNEVAHWGYSPLHTVLATVNMLGVPVALLVGLGGLFVLLDIKNPGNAFWTIATVGCVVCLPILPKLIVFNPMYIFLFTFPLLVLAARFVEHVFQRLRGSGTMGAFVIASAWFLFVCGLNFPSLASYYLDGSRCDHREAFHYVQEHWRKGDRLTGTMMGAAEWYIPNCVPRIPLRTERTEEKLQELIESENGGRLWIVVPSHRGGLDLDLRRWLGRNTSYELRVGKKRFDYEENTVEVFLHTPKTDPCFEPSPNPSAR